MEDTVPRCDAPDCSTDDAVPGSSRPESQARQATNAICGLSRRVTLAVLLRLTVEELRLELDRRGIAVESNHRDDMSNQLWDEIDGNAKNKEGQGTVMESDLSREVSLAVLPRLHKEELRWELRRRNIRTDLQDSGEEGMMKRLFDEMGKEYFGQQTSSTDLGTNTSRRGMGSDLSREVSLAVLPRLHEDELRWELRRRNIVPAAEDSQDGLMKLLFDDMGKEYFGQKVKSASLGTNTRNSQMQEFEAPAEQEGTNEAAPMQEAPPRAIRTTDAEPTLLAPTGAEGIGDGGVKETLGKGQMHKALSRAVDTEDIVMFVGKFMSGTDINVGAGPSVDDSLNTSFGPALKRKEEYNPRLDTPTKRSRWHETTKEGILCKVATSERPWVEEPMTAEEEPSLSFGMTSKSGEASQTGAGPGSSAITGMYDAGRSADLSPQPHVQRAGDNRWNCPECPFKARSESSFDEHYRGKHLHEKQFKCRVCGWRTAWKSNLSAHMKKHPKSAD